jgi:serine/threonine-protein kinase
LSSATPTLPGEPSTAPPVTAAPRDAGAKRPPAVTFAPAPPAGLLPPAPAPRQLGRFSLTRLLRKEKNSVVYLGVDPVLHREVVIKAVQLPPPSDATPHLDAQIDPLEQAFVRQAQAAGKLSHPHIVTVFEAGRLREIGYLAIERVSGRALHELIASGWRPQFVHCASIAARIADAIDYAHQQGVAHGHLGPQHVVLQVDGVPKIEGFGGWIDGGAGGDEALAGTEKLLPYFHSEISEVERRADVRAVAALVYMMLTGRAPGARPAPVAALRSAVPPALARLVDETLSPAGAAVLHRSAGDLRDALTAYLWSERHDHVAPATIGIPLAAAPRRAADPAAAPLRSAADAPTVAVEAAPARSRAGAGPATLTIRPATPKPAPAPTLPPANDSTPPPERTARQQLEALRLQLRPLLQQHRIAVGGVAGLAVSALVIAALLAATAGSPGPAIAPAAAPAAAPAQAIGVVRLEIAPWGEVFVNGKPIGVSPPLQELQLPAGRHAVEIRHGDKSAISAQIDVDASRALLIRHRFE